jgi:hypothetical protein
MEKAVWDYIHGYASMEQPELVTFFDHYDQTLYRDVSIQTIGQHGWELVSVLVTPDARSKSTRLAYFFKRNRAAGYTAGVARDRTN